MINWITEWEKWIAPLAPWQGPQCVQEDGVYEGNVPDVQVVDDKESDWRTVILGCCFISFLVLAAATILALVLLGPMLGF